jgi:hypothetical protein
MVDPQLINKETMNTMEQIPYDSAWHTVPANLREEKPVKVRIKLRQSVKVCLEPVAQSKLGCDTQAADLLAQQLAFFPAVNSGWMSSDNEFDKLAQDLVDCYLALLEVFSTEGFAAPAQAALEALKAFDFAI